jgi:hypothetical protein
MTKALSLQNENDFHFHGVSATPKIMWRNWMGAHFGLV